MKIDFEHSDSPEQVKNLKTLLASEKPTEEDIVTAILLASLIFYKNRPGKLNHLDTYNIHGTGCHNPTSEKTGKTRWGVWRLEVTIGFHKSVLVIKREDVKGGHIRAVFKNEGKEQIIAADIFTGKENDGIEARSISITGKNYGDFMKDLYMLLKEPLDALLTIMSSIPS